MNRMRVAIFGGSFDPIHNGHVALASEVLRQNLADEVWFMVSPQNPHKQAMRLSDEGDRLKMVQLAIEGVQNFVASDFEFTMPRPSYTLHTLDALQSAYPDKTFLLLIGADNWSKFNTWYRADEIISRYSLIVYPRGKVRKTLLPHNVHWLDSPLFDISSTQIREAVACGDDVSQWIAPSVLEYIKEKKLYK